MFSFYIIYSKKLDTYYSGHSSDMDKRIKEHNNGISKFTSKADDWSIVYLESFETREKAFARECEIKKKKSRKYIEWLLSK